ncbi:MAG TPA: RNA polymerase sigma factor, partial [Acidimicrobiales bacterium]|nr:RNA polymerase sigma factor [Acidimicrobiales bacterium]
HFEPTFPPQLVTAAQQADQPGQRFRRWLARFGSLQSPARSVALGIPHAASLDPESPDSALIAASRRGNRDALEMLLGRHYDRVHGLCRRMLGNDQDAQDATQEALIAIVRGLPRFDGRSEFSTWAYRVAANAALDEMRRRRRRPLPGLREGQEPGTPSEERFPTTGPETTWVDPGDAVSARLDVDAALAQLPEEQRMAVVLRDLLDLDYAEIAEVLAVPIGTVRSRIARGRGAMAALLEHPQTAHDNAAPRSSGPNQAEQGNSAPRLQRQREQER